MTDTRILVSHHRLAGKLTQVSVVSSKAPKKAGTVADNCLPGSRKLSCHRRKVPQAETLLGSYRRGTAALTTAACWTALGFVHATGCNAGIKMIVQDKMRNSREGSPRFCWILDQGRRGRCCVSWVSERRHLWSCYSPGWLVVAPGVERTMIQGFRRTSSGWVRRPPADSTR